MTLFRINFTLICKILILIILPGPFTVASAQILNKQFTFNEGIYLHYQDFKLNAPTIPIEKAEIDVVYAPDKYKIQIKAIYQTKANGEKEIVPLKDVWGIGLNGSVYVNYKFNFLEKGSVNSVRSDISAFNRIEELGSINLFMVHGANPYSGTYGQQTEYYMHRKIFKHESGEIVDVSVANVAKLISDDKNLSAQFKKDRKKQKNIYYYILQYNRLHPIHMASY
jgi:hypothetical protein